MFVGEHIFDQSGVLYVMVHHQPRQVVGNYILDALFILDWNVKFLEQKDLPNETGLSILLSENVLERRMIGKAHNRRSYQVLAKFIKGEDYS